ncbi:MAG: imidazolonepropionase [Ignavibacteria bacterium]|nr:imidazolonepropionase [Ignavibacteria bacterium]
MSLLVENISQLISCHTNAHLFKAGKFQSQIGLMRNVSVYIENGIIRWLGKKVPTEIKKIVKNKLDARNKVVMPGLIDSHTHLLFAGSRVNEYSMRLNGKTYEEIAKAGGGISSTVRAVRKAKRLELKNTASERLKKSISLGVTSIEIKSGYGLDSENELKMLEVINELKKESSIDIYPTFLGAHAFPGDKKKEEYINEIINKMIEHVATRRLAVFIDAFCEKGYYTPSECIRIFEIGRKFGLIPKLHTNQFHSYGGIQAAVKSRCISVDHLEVISEKEINHLKDRGIIAVLLPSVSYFLDIPYAPARKLIENSIPVALATDFNPGSSMTQNLQLVMNMGVHLLKMKIEEVINSVTINAAAALGISHITGSIERGKKADMVIFNTDDYREIFYNLGVNLVDKVIKEGKVIYKN